MATLFIRYMCIVMIFSFFSCKKKVSPLSENYFYKNGKISFIPGGNGFERGEQKMDADPESFVVINDLYAKDKHQVFFQGCPQPDIDVATFQLKKGIPIDKNHVYFSNTIVSVSASCRGKTLEIIPNADPVTYQRLEPIRNNWAKDSQRYFYRNSPVEVDYQTFEILNTYFAKDTHTVYVIGDKLEPFNYRFKDLAVIGKQYVMLDHHTLLFYDPLLDIGLRELEINAKTVTLLDENTVQTDHNIVYKGKLFEGVTDPASFEILKNSTPFYFWCRDKTHVFYNEKIVQDADPATFEVMHYAIAKDKNHVYVGEQIMNNIDPTTFKKAPKTEQSNYDFVGSSGIKYRYVIKNNEPALEVVK